MNWKQTLIAALVLGVVAGAVVWWLERFQAERLGDQLSREITTYLGKIDAFKAWEAAQGGNG